jgi:hypothetical protein
VLSKEHGRSFGQGLGVQVIKGTEILEPAVLNAVNCSGNDVPGRALLHDIHSDGKASTLSIVA